MENLKNFYDKYSVYLTRSRLELLAVVAIVFCAVLVFFLNIPGKGVLKLDNGTIVYDGSLVRGKMNGQGTITFQMETSILVVSTMEPSTEKVPFNLRRLDLRRHFVNGQAEGKGKLTTEQEVVYEGTFKQGVFQQK